VNVMLVELEPSRGACQKQPNKSRNLAHGKLKWNGTARESEEQVTISCACRAEISVTKC